MSQISFADAEYAGKRKKTRRDVFLEEMELVVPWKVLVEIIEPHYPVAGRGRRRSRAVSQRDGPPPPNVRTAAGSKGHCRGTCLISACDEPATAKH